MKKYSTLLIGVLIPFTSLLSQWVTQNPGFTTATKIFSIKAVNAQTVWIGGIDTAQVGNPSYRFAKSVNGGTTWITYPAIAGYTAYSLGNITAINGDTAWVSLYDGNAGGGVIMRTTNGGTSWQHQNTALFTAPFGFPNFVHFFDRNNGVCMGDPTSGYFEIYTTNNGGVNWNRVPSANIPAPRSNEYGTINEFSAEANTVYFTTTQGRLFVSTNRGASWSVSQLGLGSDSAYFNWVSPISATQALASVYFPGANMNYLATTINSGQTWTLSSWVGTVDFNSADYVSLSNNIGFHITHSGSSINHSYNGGSTWNPIRANLNNIARWFEGSVDGTLGAAWVGGRYHNASSTGLIKYIQPAKDIIPFSVGVGNGKTNCFTNENVQITLLNTGTSPVDMAVNNAAINMGISTANTTQGPFSTPTSFNNTITSGVIQPGATFTTTFPGFTAPLNTLVHAISTVVNLNDTNTLTKYNDTARTIIFDRVPRITARVQMTGQVVAGTVSGGTAITLFCSAPFTTVQWQSRNIVGNWVNETASGSTANNYVIYPTTSRYYRAVLCGNISSDSVLINVNELRKVRFRVDMSGVGVNPLGVRIAGNFNDVNYDNTPENPGLINWDPTAYSMSNGGSGSIFSITFDLKANQAYEFKFINGSGWGNVETTPAHSWVNASNNNRWIFIPTGGDTLILPAIRFAQPAPVGKVAINVAVNMKDASSLNNKYIFGSFNGFNSQQISNYLQDGSFGGTIFRTTIYPDTATPLTYKFLDGIAGFEDIPLACGTGAPFNDRFTNADINKTLPTVCYASCIGCSYPIKTVDTVQLVSNSKLTAIPINDSADYISPVFSNSVYRDTVSVSGTVVFNPRLYGLSTARKAFYLQRPGGGPWSGVQIMCEPSGSGTTLANFLTETQFYQKAQRNSVLRATGIIRAFQNETQLNILRNNSADSTLKTMGYLPSTTYSIINISELMTGGLKASNGTINKLTGEKWEGVYVQLNNVIVDTVYNSSGTRFIWKVRDAQNNAISISDFSGFFRNDNNEDSAIANTYAPPAINTQFQYIRGIIREINVSGFQIYQLAPLYPDDIGPGGIIPVKLFAFNANLEQASVLLNWSTASESNNSHFILERAIEKTGFKQVAQIKGNGTSASINHYAYYDVEGYQAHKSGSTIYYRLKQVDYDGKFEYSNTITVSPIVIKEFEIYPNPASQTLTINGLEQTCFLFDITGKKLISIEANGTVDIANLKPGIYFIQSGNQTKKFIKQ
jgi:hypothetical protein